MIIAEPHRSASQASPNAVNERERRRRARQLDPARPAEEHWNDMPSDQKRCHQKAHRARGRLEDPQPRDLPAFGQLGHDAQDQEPQHVVDHGGAQDDLTLGLVQPPQVREHPRRDSHAGRRQASRPRRSRQPCSDPAAGKPRSPAQTATPPPPPPPPATSHPLSKAGPGRSPDRSQTAGSPRPARKAVESSRARGFTNPSTDFPTTTPPISSPSTAGCPARCAR